MRAVPKLDPPMRLFACGLLLLLLLTYAPSADAQLKKRNEVSPPLPVVGRELTRVCQVSIGYMLNFNPWKLAVNLGTFERVRRNIDRHCRD